MHNHNPLVIDYRNDFEKALSGYADAGIRVQFNPCVLDLSILVYGDTQGFLDGLPENLKSVLLQMRPNGILMVDQFIEEVKRLHATSDSSMVKIGFGPLGPHMVKDDLLMAVRLAADALGAPIHVHSLQTILQKIYAQKYLGKSIIKHLDDIGFLGKGLTIGHCTWLTEKDIELLAATHTAVTHHAACNLRLRCGIAPVFEIQDAGVLVGIGMDDKSLNDDQDFLQEMRTAFHLQKLADLSIASAYVSPRQIFKMATQNSAELLGFGEMVGRLDAGRKADLVLLDYDAMCGHYCDPAHDPIDTLIYRGRKNHVDTVMVNGRVVVKAGKVQTIDIKKVGERLRGVAESPLTEMEQGMNMFWDALKKQVVKFYLPWQDELQSDPYYIVNSRL
jgi:cytosine/adenosine deaminase-related metal-dependent hydrolase